MTIENYEFKPLNLVQTKMLVNWAENEGWNPGPFDAEAFFHSDPNGFYGYFLDGEMIGGGSIVSYLNDFGFMGFFIIKPEYRSKGIGRKLWYMRRDTLLARLNPGAPIGMDGVVEMQAFYRKGGFELAFRDERHERTGEEFPIASSVTGISDDDFDEIMLYDKSCFGSDRSHFMKKWIKLPGNKTFKFKIKGNLKGYAIMRKAVTGYKIGPLFASDIHVAAELYKACLNAVPAEPVYLDIPVANKAAVQLIKEFHTSCTFECARMYYGKPPLIDLEKVFGITTFELG